MLLSNRKNLQFAIKFAKQCYHQYQTNSAAICSQNHPSTSKNEPNNCRMPKLIEGVNQRGHNLQSPILKEINEENYLQLFCKQIAIENSCFIKVKNLARRSKQEQTMEKLIESWGWKEEIEKNLNEILHAKLKELSKELNLYFKRIDLNQLTNELLTLIFAILCRGQKAISISELDIIFSRIILNTHESFKLQKNQQENLEKIFKEYLKYYTDENISKNYSIREWWYQCTKKLGFKADHYPKSSDFFQISINKLNDLLISFLIKYCEFPLNKENKEGCKKVPAFSIIDVPIHELNPHTLEEKKKKTKINLCKMLKFHPKLIEFGLLHQFEFYYFPSHLLPMKVPPRPWLDRGKCGPNYLFKQNLIRKLDEYPEIDVNAKILDDRIKDDEQARDVFDALNLLGAIPWKINEEILGHLMTAFNMSEIHDKLKALFLKKLKIPWSPQSFSISPDFAIFEMEYLKRKKMGEKDKNDEQIQNDIQKSFANFLENRKKFKGEQKSLWCWLVYRLVLANHYAGQIIYFPHNIDFRGRTYPISPQINHMGDDINRGLLKFANGKLLGEDGFRWLQLHCINITGQMKRSPLEVRLKYAEKHRDAILMAAEKPFDGGDFWWKNSDEPWQTLAACIEIRDALNSGNLQTFCSSLPIHQDGSCNGLQHYAALGRDLDGAREVNLLPMKKPQDIYTTVVETVEKRRVEDEGNPEGRYYEIAKDFRRLMPSQLKRKIIKQSVMTTVYGVTQFGASRQIKRQLLDKGIPKDKAPKISSWLAVRTLNGLSDAFQNSMDLMEWFKSCAAQILKLKRPVEWKTPLGLPVIQPYMVIGKVDNSLGFLPIPHKQKNAFPPNFIHSLDSTHMMMTAKHCHEEGITFAAVHDCFWTHACDVNTMNKICREQFVALHEQQIIEKLSQSFLCTYLTEDLRAAIPDKQLEQIERVFKPSMKTGELDIKQVLDSTYFFS